MVHHLHKTRGEQMREMKSYYQFHAKIYDATRWAFLFGRDHLIEKLPLQDRADFRVLEVGCGTGINLRHVAEKTSTAQLLGIEISPDMCTKARSALAPYDNRLHLENRPYELGVSLAEPVDIIYFSYSLCMMNPYWQEILEQAYADLKPGGHFAMVDFHDTHNEIYRDYMRSNHVRVDGHLLPAVQRMFSGRYLKLGRGWLGIWKYMVFIGQKV